MLGNLCVIYIFAFSLPHMAVMEKTHSNVSLCKIYCIQKGVVSDPKNLCDNYLVASRLCMGKAHLKIKYYKRGLGLKKDCVMNMGQLRHEYKMVWILKATFFATS